MKTFKRNIDLSTGFVSRSTAGENFWLMVELFNEECKSQDVKCVANSDMAYGFERFNLNLVTSALELKDFAYCNLEEFLNDGYKIVGGDVIVDSGGYIWHVDPSVVGNWNKIIYNDFKRLVIKAAALETQVEFDNTSSQFEALVTVNPISWDSNDPSIVASEVRSCLSHFASPSKPEVKKKGFVKVKFEKNYDLFLAVERGRKFYINPNEPSEKQVITKEDLITYRYRLFEKVAPKQASNPTLDLANFMDANKHLSSFNLAKAILLMLQND